MAGHLTRAVLGLSVLALAAGCSPRERILQGERLDLRALDTTSGAPLDPTQVVAAAPDVPVNRVEPVRLAPMVANADWPQRAGGPSGRIQHPALSAVPQPAWTANIGGGDARRARATADPVVAGGRVFTLDSGATVSAVSTGGAVLWQVDLTRPGDRTRDASGGGVASDGARVYATSAFGTLTALDAATGGVIWTQDLDAPATGAPTVADGIVYVSGGDSRGWAVRAADGRVEWQVQGIPSRSGRSGGTAPAVDGRLVYFPFSSGEVLAVERAAGTPVWRSNVVGRRAGRSYATITDLSADPVVAGGVVFAGNPSGRVAAIGAEDGARRWTAEEGAMAPVWVEGDAVFLVSDQNELVRLDAATGDRVWGVQLPYFTRDRVRRQREIFVQHGPVLAGGRLWVASGDGMLRGFAPESGALVHEAPIRGGGSSNPVVAGGTLYVVTGNGQLQAFR